MFTEDLELESCTQLWKSCYQLTKIFLQGAPVKTSDLILTAESTIDINAINSLYVIKQGTLKESYNGNLIITYEEGDLIGVDALLLNKPTSINTDFAITVNEYDGLQLLEFIRADESRNQAWNQYLMSLIQAYQLLMCHHKNHEVQFHPEIRHYDMGQIIIQQGAKDDEVYTLMSGSALALVDDTVVGEVKRNEIFGIIAALTDTPRTATVKANAPCSVLVVPYSRFRELLTSRPDTVTKLIEDLARTIVTSNEKIVRLTRKDASNSQ